MMHGSTNIKFITELIYLLPNLMQRNPSRDTESDTVATIPPAPQAQETRMFINTFATISSPYLK